MIGFHGIGNSHMFEDEEMGNYHPEIENGDSNGDNETGIIGALGNKLEKTFKNSLSAMKSEHAEKVHSNAAVADEEVSIQGKILANLMGHITNDLAIGKKIKSGELRKRMKEPAWLVCNRGYRYGRFHYEAFIFKGKPKYRACDTAAAWWWIYGGSAQCILCICRPL